MRIALATVGTTGGDVRPFAIALAVAVGAEDGIGSSVALLERAGSAG